MLGNLISKYTIGNFKISELESADKTMDYARENLSDKEVIFTTNLLNAKGKGGRKWKVKPGNFYLTMVVIPKQKKLDDIAQLSFVSSIALRDAISEAAEKSGVNIEIKCKWPNDVLVNGKKIAGILLESDIDLQKVSLKKLIIGIGVNVIYSPNSNEILYKCTNLKSEGISISAQELLKYFFKYFDKYYTEWLNNGFAKIRVEWLKTAHNLHNQITVKNNDGTKSQSGVFLDLDIDGNLILKNEQDELVRIISGDVF